MRRRHRLAMTQVVDTLLCGCFTTCNHGNRLARVLSDKEHITGYTNGREYHLYHEMNRMCYHSYQCIEAIGLHIEVFESLKYGKKLASKEQPPAVYWVGEASLHKKVRGTSYD